MRHMPALGGFRCAQLLRVTVGVCLVALVLGGWGDLVAQSQSFNIGLALACAALYPVSFVLMLAVWLRMTTLQVGGRDWRRHVLIYCRTNLVRGLPLGLFWRVGGRVLQYDKLSVPRSAVVAVSLWEIALHSTAAALLLCITLLLRPVVIGVWLPGFAVLLAVSSVAVLAYRHGGPPPRVVLAAAVPGSIGAWRGLLQGRLGAVAGILGAYAITWLNAGLMLLLLVRAVAPQAAFDFVDGTQVWAVAGLAGYVAFLLPFLDVGAKEATMTVLLTAHMAPSLAVVIAILWRLVFTVCDIACSFTGLLAMRWLGAIEGQTE